MAEAPNNLTTCWRRMTTFLGLHASMTAMLVMVVCVGMGERMAERFLPIYLLALGGSNLAIGALGGLQNLLGALYSLPGGWASDRWGHRRALVAFNLVALLGFLFVLVVPRWWAVLVGATFFIAWSAVTLPAIMSLVARVLPQHKRVTGVSLHSLVRRIPMALGPVLGGALLAGFGTVAGIQIAFGLAAALCLAGVVLVLAFIPEEPPGAKKEILPPLRLFRRFDPALRSLLLSDILIRFCEQIPYAFVVVWAINLHGITPVQFGVLTAIEMTTAALIYLPVARFADRGAKKPFVVITFIFFTAFPLLLLFSRSFPMLIAAFVVRGLKEFGEPTRKSLILDLAPADARAGTFGLYYLIRDVIVALAAFGGAWLWQLSPTVNLLAATAFGALGTLWFAVYGKDFGLKKD
jgi:MFS family permease